MMLHYIGFYAELCWVLGYNYDVALQWLIYVALCWVLGYLLCCITVVAMLHYVGCYAALCCCIMLVAMVHYVLIAMLHYVVALCWLQLCCCSN